MPSWPRCPGTDAFGPGPYTVRRQREQGNRPVDRWDPDDIRFVCD